MGVNCVLSYSVHTTFVAPGYCTTNADCAAAGVTTTVASVARYVAVDLHAAKPTASAATARKDLIFQI